MKTYTVTAPTIRLRNGLRMGKSTLKVQFSERIGAPWKEMRPMVACAYRHVRREAVRQLGYDFAFKRPFVKLTAGKSWRGRANSHRCLDRVGQRFTEPRKTRYPRYTDMPEFWHRDWKEALVGLVAHELWHVWQTTRSGKQAEYECELVEWDAVDTWRREQGYGFTPPQEDTNLKTEDSDNEARWACARFQTRCPDNHQLA